MSQQQSGVAESMENLGQNQVVMQQLDAWQKMREQLEGDMQVKGDAAKTDTTSWFKKAVSAVGSPARAGTVCPRFHLMFALTHFPIRTSTCSLQYIEYYLES
jgi:hypothetical protein